MKKLRLFVLLCAVVLVSLFAAGHAFAETTFAYGEEAQILNIFGLYDGTSPDSFVPDLAAQVDRETGITLLVKMFGKKDAALAMSITEANSILSRFSDRKDISGWAKKYIAYAVKTGMVQGDTATTVSPRKPMDGRSFATMILRNLGYTIDGDGWKIALETLSQKGGLTVREASEFKKQTLIKDDIAGICYGSLGAEDVNGISLIEILVSERIVGEKEAVAMGVLRDMQTGRLRAPTEDEIAYYIIRSGLTRAYTRVDLSGYSSGNSSEAVFKMVDRVVKDTPEVLYYAGCTHWSYGALEFRYSKDRDTSLSHMKKVNERADAILKEVIEPGMTDYEKELAIHDYIVNHTRYDIENFHNGTLPPESYSAYGALVLGTSVCEGYAEAMKLLMDRLGIECIVVTGESQGQNHAWNIVKIDNAYYQLDVTWNDPVMDDGSNVLRYDYFNITDSEMARDHSWERDKYPPCESTEYNYFYRNNLVVSSRDEFLDKVKDALATGQKKLTLKALNYDESTYDIVSTVNRAARQTSGVSFTRYYYSSNPVTGIIQIEFE